jgi:hypothetical protein
LGPPSDYLDSPPGQTAAACCRQRRCLLKGCGQPFHPTHPLCRYCSEACTEEARRWSQWRANQRYRASEQGRARRREQSRRWRVLARQRREAACPTASEGYQKEPPGEEFCCSRPGCYERFRRSRRSPLKKFCSFLCRQALRRVLQRERRWRRRCLRQATTRPRPACRLRP